MSATGDGRRATQAAKLTPADAIALASALGAPRPAGVQIRSMEDLPDVAHLFHWAVAAELLTVRGAKILPGPWAEDLERDPLSTWFKAATTLLEHGLLDGFGRGWRKQYVEFLDAGARLGSPRSSTLGARPLSPRSGISSGGGWRPLMATTSTMLASVGMSTGWCSGSSPSLADLGAAERDDHAVRLTELGGALAAASAVIDDGLE